MGTHTSDKNTRTHAHTIKCSHLHRHSVHWFVQILFREIILVEIQQQTGFVDVSIEFKLNSPSVRSVCTASSVFVCVCAVMSICGATVPCALILIRTINLFIRIHFLCNQKSIKNPFYYSLFSNMANNWYNLTVQCLVSNANGSGVRNIENVLKIQGTYVTHMEMYSVQCTVNTNARVIYCSIRWVCAHFITPPTLSAFPIRIRIKSKHRAAEWWHGRLIQLFHK